MTAFLRGMERSAHHRLMQDRCHRDSFLLSPSWGYAAETPQTCDAQVRYDRGEFGDGLLYIFCTAEDVGIQKLIHRLAALAASP